MCINNNPISAFIAGGSGGTATALNASINNVSITGGSNGYYLQTDGFGVLSWQPVSSSVNTGVLQMSGGGGATSSAQYITDQNNTNLPIRAGINKLIFGNGTKVTSPIDEYIYFDIASSYLDMLFYTNAVTHPLYIGYSNAERFFLGTTASTWASVDTTNGWLLSAFDNGTTNGAVTILGKGGNILSLRNSTNVQVGSVTNAGALLMNSYGQFGGNAIIGNGNMIYWSSTANGYMEMVSTGVWSFVNVSRINIGGNTAGFPSITRSGGNIQTKYADGTSGYCGFQAGEGTKAGISVVKGGTNTPYVGFFGVTEIPQPTTSIAEAGYASGGAGANIKTDDTFGGYTLQQIAEALLELGLLQ